MIKHRMMKLVQYVHCAKAVPSSNFRAIGPIFGDHHPQIWQIDHFTKCTQGGVAPQN